MEFSGIILTSNGPKIVQDTSNWGQDWPRYFQESTRWSKLATRCHESVPGKPKMGGRWAKLSSKGRLKTVLEQFCLAIWNYLGIIS